MKFISGIYEKEWVTQMGNKKWMIGQGFIDASVHEYTLSSYTDNKKFILLRFLQWGLQDLKA